MIYRDTVLEGGSVSPLWCAAGYTRWDLSLSPTAPNCGGAQLCLSIREPPHTSGTLAELYSPGVCVFSIRTVRSSSSVDWETFDGATPLYLCSLESWAVTNCLFAYFCSWTYLMIALARLRRFCLRYCFQARCFSRCLLRMVLWCLARSKTEQ